MQHPAIKFVQRGQQFAQGVADRLLLVKVELVQLQPGGGGRYPGRITDDCPGLGRQA
ncbi:hypothetical protein D3C78_1658800 [compost metagenome]